MNELIVDGLKLLFSLIALAFIAAWLSVHHRKVNKNIKYCPECGAEMVKQ